MIKTKESVVINARINEMAVVFLDTPGFTLDEVNERVGFVVNSYVQDEKNPTGFTKIASWPADYSLKTFLESMGSITFSEYIERKNELMISEIAKNSDKYWGLTADQMEVYVPEKK